jgi:uncharacterized protein with HEPN domain
MARRFQIADDIKIQESQIPWALIKGMRNRLINSGVYIRE